MKFLIPVSLLLLSSCDATPVSQSNTDNAAITAELLFTHDGCKVYRFWDGGRRHFFVKCHNEASTSSTYRSGKTTKVETIDTETLP